VDGSTGPRSLVATGAIGWFKAHVRVGSSYPIVAVRVCHRSTPGGGVLQVLNSEDPIVLRTAAYAIETARRLDQFGGGRIDLFELDASLLAGDAGVVLELKVTVEEPAGELDEAHISEAARRVLADGTWEFVEPIEVRAELVLRAPVEVEEAASAPAEAAGAVVEEAPRREYWRPGLVAAVLVGLFLLVLPVLLVNRPAAPSTVAPAAEGTVAPTAVAGAEATAAVPTQLPAAPATQTQPGIADRVTAAVEVAAERVTPLPTATDVVPKGPLLEFVPGRSGTFGWPNNRQGAAWFDNDGYHLAARTPGRFVAIGVLPGVNLRGVMVTATFHKIAGPPGGGYGVIVGDQGPTPRDGANQDGRYLVFEVGDRGEVGVWRRDQDQWRGVVEWTPSAAVSAGLGENTLAVRASSGSVAFGVNGTDIPLHLDTQPIAGGVGVFLGGDANEAVLSRLTVTQLD
jgi:hypothetical protein